MALMATLVDDFAATSRDTAKWTQFSSGLSLINQTGGEVVVTLPGGTSTSSYGGYDSVGVAFDLTGSYAFINFAAVPNQSTGAQMFFYVGSSTTNRLEWMLEGGILKARKFVSSSSATEIATTSYNSKRHKWLRIRESGGVCYWDFSADGVNWTNMASSANPFAVTALYVEFEAGVFQSETSPGTAHFDNFNIAAATPAVTNNLPKTYLYQVYDSNNQFLGSLANVTSEFSYTQNINSGGAQIQITLANLLDDTGAVQTDEFWLDESGNRMVDENGNRIVFSALYDFNNIPIDLGNRVRVYAFYDGAPSGIQVFDGLISKWVADYDRNTIDLTVLSWGVQLDNYLISSSPTGFTIDQEVYEKEYTPTVNPGIPTYNNVAQSFNIASSAIIGAFQLFVRAGSGPFVSNPKTGETITPLAILNWQLYAGTPASPGSIIDSGTVQFTGTAIRIVTLKLGQPRTLLGNYFLVLKSGNAGSQYYTDPVIEATATNPYAGGSVYTGPDTGSGTVWSAVAADDLAFMVLSTAGSTAISFTNQDPSFILTNIMDQLIAQGGILNYSGLTIENTNSSGSYDYKVQTVLEGIQKVLSLAPEGWYWYVDMATNMLHFHPTPNYVNHLLVLGNHIANLNIEYSLEEVVNTVYLTGGPTAGVNLFIAQKDAASAARYGQWMERITDNRVTSATVAGVIAAGEIGSKGAPTFHTTVEVPAQTYDIETFNVGDMVGFRANSNLIDTLVFQIASLSRYPDRAVLQLGTLRPRQSSELENIKRRLNYLETLDNPSTPS